MINSVQKNRCGDSTAHYNVLQRHSTSGDTELVLCDRGENTPQRFVVWTRSLKEGFTFWGNYFDDLNEAAKCFAQKTGRRV